MDNYKLNRIWILLIFTGLVACNRSRSDKHSEKLPSDTTQTRIANPGVKINLQTQKLEGIRVARPDSGSYQEHLDAYGVVLSPAGLVTLQNQYVKETQLIRKYKAQLQVSHQEYKRLDTLYRHHSTSQEDYQTARMEWVSDQADLAESKQDLRSLVDSSRQVWGPVITHWLQTNNNVIQRIIRQRTWLVQVTPAGPIHVHETFPPKEVSVGVTKQQMFPARFISPSPGLDPQFQHTGYYYLVNHSPVILAPGTNVIAEVPVGKKQPVIVIPDSAVVWWQGEPWIYIKRGTKQFDRYSMAGVPFSDSHWYVGTDIIPIHHSDNLVVSGVQFLLEKELLAGVPTVSAGENDGDDD
ncbi:MAG TPA: hypothetical protein VKA08_08575 [Balneolales bacterium]|nr:hypothetical protein [Balneolales bacterium]